MQEMKESKFQLVQKISEGRNKNWLQFSSLETHGGRAGEYSPCGVTKELDGIYNRAYYSAWQRLKEGARCCEEDDDELHVR